MIDVLDTVNIECQYLVNYFSFVYFEHPIAAGRSHPDFITDMPNFWNIDAHNSLPDNASGRSLECEAKSQRV